jgi:4a-hydroxytetrahydrobiopterin dehydratase
LVPDSQTGTAEVDNGGMPPLPADRIAERLSTLPGWTREGDEIVKTFELPTFADAIAFVTRVAERAEAADHHPDLDIRYRKVRVALSTHDAGGLTDKDFDLAAEIEVCRS